MVVALLAVVPARAALAPMAGGGGSGSLHLVGDEFASFDVQGKIVSWGTIPTPGRLEVKGKPGTFSVRIDGTLQKPNRRGVVRLDNVAGRFAIQGAPGVKVRIEGSDIEASVAGRGTAIPSGTGTYSLNGAAYVSWTGQPIAIAPAPRLRKPPVRDREPTTTEKPSSTNEESRDT
jgi:hypothetical protein